MTAEELIAAGYTVEFAYNMNLTGTTEAKEKATKQGIIDGSAYSNGFKYAVTVTPPEGEAFEQTEFASVKVTSATTATSVDGVKLVVGDEDYKLDYVTIDSAQAVDFKATGAKNAFGESLQTIPDVESVKSLTTEVAYYENQKIVGVSEGTAEFEVKFKGIKDAVKVSVEIKAATNATSLKETSAKISTSGKVEITVLDQYKEAINVTDASVYTVKVTDDKGVEVPADDYTIDLENDKLTISDLAKGSYTVEVVKGTDKLGTISVEVIDATTAVAESFKIVANDNTKLEITSTIATPTKGYTLKGIADGLTLDNLNATIADLKADNNGNGEIKISVADPKVAIATINKDTGAITVTAQSAGTTNATVSFVAGSYSKKLATLDIVVTNTTPQYSKETVTIKDTTAKAIVLEGSITPATVAAKLAYNTDKALEADSIDSVKLLNTTITDGKVTGTLNVKFKSVYGGKTVAYPVQVTALESTKTPSQENTFTENGGSGLDGIGSTNAAAITSDAGKIAFDVSKVTDSVKTLESIYADQNAEGHGGAGRVLADVKISEENSDLVALFAGSKASTFYTKSDISHLDSNTALFYVKLASKASEDAELVAAPESTTTYTAVWSKNDGSYKVETYTVKINPAAL